MSVAKMFEQFVNNLAIGNVAQISSRYGEITCCLNKKYRDTESKTSNSLQVGSYGRFTAINGVSDLDMIYIMPFSEWGRFKDNRQSALLQEVKGVIKARYPNTEIRGDGQVVVVSFENQEFEVVPAFELNDGSFKYPDTHNGGSWKITKPRDEIREISSMDAAKNKNLRRLCKMVRAWKNKHGVAMGGLLIDTLAYNFLTSTTDYDDKSYLYYDFMVRDFFCYLKDLESQDYYLAPGSSQRVYVKKSFHRKAKQAYKLCLKAIEAEDKPSVNNKWKKVFGRPFPASVAVEEGVKGNGYSWDNTEEFIEDRYPIDIRYSLELDSDVSQQGYRPYKLRDMLAKRIPLFPKKKLLFSIVENGVPEPYTIEWKVLNRGEVARKRNEIRGQIVPGGPTKKENTKFRGDHLVECYIIKNNVVVARARIDVPIKPGGEDE